MVASTPEPCQPAAYVLIPVGGGLLGFPYWRCPCGAWGAPRRRDDEAPAVTALRAANGHGRSTP